MSDVNFMLILESPFHPENECVSNLENISEGFFLVMLLNLKIWSFECDVISWGFLFFTICFVRSTGMWRKKLFEDFFIRMEGPVDN